MPHNDQCYSLSPEDIALIERDRGLTGLSTLINVDAFRALLEAMFPKTQWGESVSAYVRYKPGTNCLAAYRLPANGELIDVYAKAYQGTAGGKLYKSGQSRMRTIAGDVPVVVEDLGLAIYVFPYDQNLPALGRLAKAETARLFLQRLLPGHPHFCEGRFSQLRYKPERRYVARLSVDDEPVAALKFYTSDRFEAAHQGAHSLQSRDLLTMPRRLGSSRRHATMAFEWLAGISGDEYIVRQEDHRGVLLKIGAALAELHMQDVETLEMPVRAAEDQSLTEAAAFVRSLVPALGDRSDSLAKRLAARLTETLNRRTPIHGDFYAQQLIVQRDKIAMLDLDNAALGDPASDLGNFIAHLERAVLEGRMPPARRDRCVEAMLEGYWMTAEHSIPKGIPAYTAASLMRLAPEAFRKREPDWSHRIESIIARAEDTLSQAPDFERTFRSTVAKAPSAERAVHDVPVIDPFGVRNDPAMSHLAEALDADAVRGHFEMHVPKVSETVGGRRICAIRVRRHKPGRRCLIEYHLADMETDKVLVVLAKFYAKRWKKSRWRVPAALRKAGFHDKSRDGVSVPRPLGVVRELNMWLQSKVGGVTATELLGTTDGPNVARRIAEAIYKVHVSGVPTSKRHTVADELFILEDRLGMVAQARLEWANRIDRILADCKRDAARLNETDVCGIHRDFYPDQVLVDGERIYLLDFDLYTEGPPAIDIGNFRAHLIEQSVRRLGCADGLVNCEMAFQERYLELVGRDCRPQIEVATTLSLARHIFITTQFPKRREFTEAMITLCEQRLRPANTNGSRRE